MTEITEFTGGINGLPMFEDRKKMWTELQIEPIANIPPAIDSYLQALRVVYDQGSARFASCRVKEHPVFDWYFSRNQFHEMGFFEHFWGQPFGRQIMPEKLADLNFYSLDVFNWESPLILGGSLAAMLYEGGAYKRHAGGGIDAKRLGEAAAAQLIHDDYDNSLVFASHTAWSEYFDNVVWDYTKIVVDKSARLIHVLVATDTD